MLLLHTMEANRTCAHDAVGAVTLTEVILAPFLWQDLENVKLFIYIKTSASVSLLADTDPKLYEHRCSQRFWIDLRILFN